MHVRILASRPNVSVCGVLYFITSLYSDIFVLEVNLQKETILVIKVSQCRHNLIALYRIGIVHEMTHANHIISSFKSSIFANFFFNH